MKELGEQLKKQEKKYYVGAYKGWNFYGQF